MPTTYYFEEIPNNVPNRRRTIHKVMVPGVSEKGFYRDVGALNAFTSGRRAGSSAIDVKAHHDRCNRAPTALYTLRTVEDWPMDFDAISRISKQASVPGLPTIVAETYGADYQSPFDIPTVDHASITAFLTYIGFDRKRRRYVDANGKLIKYSFVAERKPPAASDS